MAEKKPVSKAEVESRLDSFYKRIAADYRKNHKEKVLFYPSSNSEKYFALLKEEQNSLIRSTHVIICKRTGEVFCPHRNEIGGFQTTFFTIFDSDKELRGIHHGEPYAY